MASQSHLDKVNHKPNILPYPSHVGSPKIEPVDLTYFKEKSLRQVDKILQRKYDELVKEAETFQKMIELNKEVYESKFKFEPIIGGIYHLYEEDDGSKMLTLIGPSEWDRKYLYSVVLNSDLTWGKIDLD